MAERRGGVDLFVSYTAADRAWAEWIAWQLEAAGYQVLLQAWDFRPGDNFIQRMDQALAEADRVLAVLSPRYFASAYATDEWTAALVRRAGEADRLLPVRIEASDLPPLIANRIYIDLVGLDAEAAGAALLAGLGRERRKPDRPPAFPAVQAAGAPGFPGLAPAISNLPPRNPAFTGREPLLARLRRQLTVGGGSGGPVAVRAGALFGLGGVGKTQLALEYAHRYGADYDLIWWIPAEDPLAIPPCWPGWAPGSVWHPWATRRTWPPRPWIPSAGATAGCWCSTTPSSPTSWPAGSRAAVAGVCL